MTEASPDGSSAPAGDPDVPAGADQTERVILAAAEEARAAAPPLGARGVIVVDDATGRLIAAALGTARVHAWSASRARTLALADRFAAPIAAGDLVLADDRDPVGLAEFAAASGADLALLRLPKALAALETRARALARSDRELTLVGGGRVKHMTRQQNTVLARSFRDVRATRGIGKSRALVAAGPHPQVAAPAPVRGTPQVIVRGQERRIALRGIGGVFGAAGADAGSRLLLQALDRAVVAGEVAGQRAADLGCGNGLLTAYLAAALPAADVLGSDDDIEAVVSTRATLAASGLERAAVTWDDSLSREADDSVDLVLLNPPFHDGPGIDPTLVQGLLDAAARVLRPGGQLWFVHNSALRYRGEVEARVGPVRQRERDRRFTVLQAHRA